MRNQINVNINIKHTNPDVITTDATLAQWEATIDKRLSKLISGLQLDFGPAFIITADTTTDDTPEA